MQLPQKKDEYYTYEDYASWDTDIRYELIDGVPYAMASPSRTHQRILRKLSTTIDTYLKGKSCELFIAPFDVRLNFDTLDDTVVQPDLLVICDPKKLDEKGVNGAPDIAVEIVSPSSIRIDLILKYNKYMQAGVLEYWVIRPEERTVQVFILKDGNYISKYYSDTDKLKVHILEDCEIDLSEIFSD